MSAKDTQAKNESLFDRIVLACGYVLICLILTGLLGGIVLLGALAATLILALVLLGIALFLGGLVLTGVGLVHCISMPRVSFINVGSGMILAVTGVLTELFLFWAALDAVPWIIGKIRKTTPRVMAKDIRRLCGKVLRVNLILGVLGIVFIVAGLLLGGATDIRKRAVLAYRETMDAIEDTVRVMPYTKSVPNVNRELKLFHGDEQYTCLAAKDEVTALKVSTVSGIFSILPNEKDEYAVQSFESGDYQAFVEEGTLIVDVFPYLHSAKEEDLPEVILYVPEEVWFDSLEIYCSGRAMVSTADLKGEEAFVYFPMGEAVFIDRMDFDEVHLTSGFGDLTVEHLKAGTVFADAGSGEMMLKDLQAGDLNLAESSGKLGVYGRVSGNIDIRCGVGEVEIAFEAPGGETASPESVFRLSDYHLSLKGTPRELIIGGESYKGSPLYYSKEGQTLKHISVDSRLGKVRIN